MVYHGEFGGASLVHFPCIMSRRIFPGQTFFFPPKKPKMTTEWQNGRMAGMATYVLFTVHTNDDDDDDDGDDDDDDDDDNAL